jgi:hypothetical protein
MAWFDPNGIELHRVAGGVGVTRFLMEAERMEATRAAAKVADRWRASSGPIAQCRLAAYEAARGKSQLAMALVRQHGMNNKPGLSGVYLSLGYFHLGRSRGMVARHYFRSATRLAISDSDTAQARLGSILCDLTTQNYTEIRQRVKDSLENAERLSAREKSFVTMVDQRLLERFHGV